MVEQSRLGEELRAKLAGQERLSVRLRQVVVAPIEQTVQTMRTQIGNGGIEAIEVIEIF